MVAVEGSVWSPLGGDCVHWKSEKVWGIQRLGVMRKRWHADVNKQKLIKVAYRS